MKPGGGSRKGSKYERDTCRKLSLWISDGKRNDLLWRAAASGAMATNYRKSRRTSYSNQSGDVSSIDPESQRFMDIFTVELKHYKDLQVENIVFQTKSILLDFWNKHVEMSKELNKQPLLIARQNRKPDLILLPADLCVHIYGPVFENENLLIILLQDFFKTPYNTFMESIEENI